MTHSQTAHHRYPDRTEKQPVVWTCSNPKCVENHKIFAFQSDKPVCPKCGCDGPPAIQMRGLIHLLAPHPQGKMKGRYARYNLACDAKRTYITCGDNNEGGSDNVDAVNCPGCLAFAKRSRILGALGQPLKKDDVTVVEPDEKE